MPRKGGPEHGALLYLRKRLCRHRSDGGNVIKRRRAVIEPGKAGREVEHLAVQDQTGFFAGCGAVTHELHGLYNIRGSCKTASQYIIPEERRV
jgi:hypothetical protein